MLRNFDADDLRRRFGDHLDKLTADFTFGKVCVLQEIAKAKKKPAEARAVIQIGIVIGGTDGDVDKTEQAVVREACSRSTCRRTSSTCGSPPAPAVPARRPGHVRWLRRRAWHACATSRTPPPGRRCGTTASGWRAPPGS